MDDGDDGYEMTQCFLNGLSKERLIELILMTEEQRDHALDKGVNAMLKLTEADQTEMIPQTNQQK